MTLNIFFNAMIILGVDPGTRITGFGIIRSHNAQFQVLDYGTIRPPAKAPLPKRYLAIFEALCHLISKLSACWAGRRDPICSEKCAKCP